MLVCDVWVVCVLPVLCVSRVFRVCDVGGVCDEDYGEGSAELSPETLCSGDHGCRGHGG